MGVSGEVVGRELYPACFKDVFKAVKFLVQPRQARLHTGLSFKVGAGVFVLLLNEGWQWSDWNPTTVN